MKSKLNKLIFTIFFAMCFIGCSSISTYLGEKKIERGINIYSSQGITEEGIKTLASGLKYEPTSAMGKEYFNRQSREIITIKNNILKKNYHTEGDIKNLKTFLVLNEEGLKIAPKVAGLNINYQDYINSKDRIRGVFEKYVSEDYKKIQGLNREVKISRINYYKSLLKYSESPRITNIIYELENQVTISINIVSSFIRYSHLNSMIRDSIMEFSWQNKGKKIKEYVYFKGYSDYIAQDKGTYLIAIEVSDTRDRVISVETTKKYGKDYIIENKELVIRGNYKFIKEGVPQRNKYFSFVEKYKVEYEKNTYKDDREEIRKIINNKFKNKVLREIKDII